MPRQATYNNFGESVSRALADSGLTQTVLAEKLDKTVGYLNNTMTGKAAASPKWADLVADVLKVSAAKRTELHVGAAKDKGYKIDLTPSPKNRR